MRYAAACAVEGDLGTWTPPPRGFDLASCLYVHMAGSVGEMVTRLGSGVAPGGQPRDVEDVVSLGLPESCANPRSWGVFLQVNAI